MLQTETTVLKLQESQVEQGADLLARVFQHDSMMHYLVGDPARLLDKPRRFYQATIRMGLLNGEVYTTPSVDGIAVWVSPGNTDFTMTQLLQTGLLRATLSMGLRSLLRMMRAADYMEKIKERAIPEPHWELMFVGVEASKRGKGIGETLLHPILNRADAEHSSIFLESMNEQNLSFYKRLGFVVAAEGQVPEGGPHYWGMLRKPR